MGLADFPNANGKHPLEAICIYPIRNLILLNQADAIQFAVSQSGKQYGETVLILSDTLASFRSGALTGIGPFGKDLGKDSRPSFCPQRYPSIP